MIYYQSTAVKSWQLIYYGTNQFQYAPCEENVRASDSCYRLATVSKVTIQQLQCYLAIYGIERYFCCLFVVRYFVHHPDDPEEGHEQMHTRGMDEDYH